MGIDILDKLVKGFTGTKGLVDASDVETTGDSNAQAQLDSRIDGAVRNGNNIRFTRGNGDTFDVSVLDTGVDPSFTSFTVGTQGETVDAPFTFSGATAYSYSMLNPGNIDGVLTVQDESNRAIAVNITPQASGSAFGLISPGNEITLNAGESHTFTIQGTNSLDNSLVTRTYTVTARNVQDFVYLQADDNNTASDVDTGAATAVPFQSGNQVVTIPTFSTNSYLKIAQRASDPEITQILIGGINQFAAFTKTDDATTIDGVSFDVYVSNNLLVAAAVSGTQMTLVRG